MTTHSTRLDASMRLAATTIIAGCLTLGLGNGTAHAQASQTAANVYNHAGIVINNLAQTFYSYETAGGLPNVATDSNGTFTVDTDCSGWISYLLGGSAPNNYNGFYNFFLNYMANFTKNNPGYVSGDKYPQAFVYAAGFRQLQTQPTAIPGFTAVTDLRTVQKGDIIAWCGTTFCNGQASSGDTGHVMLAIGPAQAVTVDCSSATPANSQMCGSIIPTALGNSRQSLAGAVYAVEVADESCLSHYTAAAATPPLASAGWKSTRTFNSPPCTPATGNANSLGGGVGTGFIYFTVNASGVPLQHQFAPGDPFFPQYTAGTNVATFTTQAVGQTNIGRLVDVASAVN